MSGNTGSRFPELVEVMQTLLGPGGCPWDREQTLASLRPYLIEECFELVDAIDRDDTDNHREELGDLLLAMANLCRHLGVDPEGTLARANDKFRRRFAHIEGLLHDTGKRVEQSTLEELNRLWDEAKAEERGDSP